MDAIKKIVLTGGPCAGKTTALSYVPEKLRNLGYGVITVPEAATELMLNGVLIGNRELSVRDFQKQVLLRTIESEKRFEQILRLFRNNKGVLLLDRGKMDGAAYTDDFESLLREVGLSIPEARDCYDGVLHLVTAADGAEIFYTLENNNMRKETPAEAIAQDIKTRKAWIGSPHFKIIDNSTDFEGKMKRLLSAVYRVVGIPAPIEIERKFLIESLDVSLIPVPMVEIIIEQVYLVSGTDTDIRVRAREQNGHFIYYLAEKKFISLGKRYETEKQINLETYTELIQTRKSPLCGAIRKKRYCFIWKNQYFELDVFMGKLAPLHILEIELTEENDRIEIPPFIKVIKDVTDDGSFYNKTLSLKA